MNCETVRELLGNYIDEELTQTMRVSVDRHVAGCKTCAADLATLQNAVAKIAESAEVEQPSPWFTERLLHRLAEQNETSLTLIESPSENKQLGLW
jgi:anti-sigma factor RsiW